MRKLIKKAIAVTVAASLAIGTFFTGATPIVKADAAGNAEATEKTYPWTPIEGGTTGDYIADSYNGIKSGHVFESVTQQRLLDILSSEGNYYIVFGGPEHATSQTVLATINDQAKAAGITRIYHFDPYIDGYQIDITDANTVFKTSQSVYKLWQTIVTLLPESEVIDNYSSSDTLLFAISNDGKSKEIKASYSLKDIKDFDKTSAKSEIAKVFRGGVADGAVVKSDIRTDYEFFKRVYNESAKNEIFTDADKENFALHQVNFNELINLLNSKGEYTIFFGASWCGNTQAIVGQVARKARANGKVVYVYDTTVGNQISFGTGANADTITGSSSTFNSRTSASSNGNNNISYLYGEVVKYLGDFITENSSKKNNQIAYYPNGDINGTITSVKPWEEAEEGVVKSASRLQLPFLIGYDKDAAQPVTKQWIHKNQADDGTYKEYMLSLAQVLNPDNYTTGNNDGLTNGEFAKEGVAALSNVFGDNPEDYEPVYEDCDGDGYDDVTGKKLPWYGFDATKGDEIPEYWNGITIYRNYEDYLNAQQATEQETVAEDYIANVYTGVESGHVFESVTQERLLDILSSKGNYYIVFGGPEHTTSQTVLATINDQAKEDGITKIYHFDPYIDGYQIDITDKNSAFKGQRVSVYELWKRIVELLPESDAITNYDSSDTLLFAISNDGTSKEIKASYSLKETDRFNKVAAKNSIAKVFRGGVANGRVVKSDVRTDFEFFKRVYNAAATYVETLQGDEPTTNRLGKATEIFTDADEEGFALHQVNYNELVNLLQSEGEYYIFFGASWCHNTQAIIGQVERKAKANGKTVYVYDTTVGNQLTFGTGDEIDTVIGTSSAFNSRNSATTADGNNNISYLYGEFVKYLGDFITENNSNKNNSIAYFPNGDLTGAVTTVKPWENVEEGTVKNAIRLQMPFLIGYDKDAEQPVTKQWLHKNAANDGTYTEYMLELAWVLGTPEAVAGGGNKDGLSYVEFAAEAVKELSTVLGDKEPEVVPGNNNNETTTGAKEETTVAPTTLAPTTTAAKVTAPAKVKIKKIATKKKSAKKINITLKKIKAKGYQIAIYKTKKNAKKDKKALVKKIVKKANVAKVTVSSKKLKNQKNLFVKVRAYNLNGKKKVYGKWSAVKKVKIK